MVAPPRIPAHPPAAPTPMREPEDSGYPQIPKTGGCPTCRRISRWDEKYRFWSLHENYSFPECNE
jgi:hypothetical protein